MRLHEDAIKPDQGCVALLVAQPRIASTTMSPAAPYAKYSCCRHV
jgi:hypothetical protein